MEIQNFHNAEFGSLRVIQNEKGEMMFCLADVCKALGIANPSVAKTRLDGGYLCTTEVSTKSKNQYGEFIRTVTLLYVRPKHPYIDIKYVKKNNTILLSRFFFFFFRSIIRFSKPIFIIKVYEETKVL